MMRSIQIRRGAHLTAGAIAFLAIGCCISPSYRGSGTIDRHLFGADVDLGVIDLSERGHYDFNMEGLSPCEMVIGFRTLERGLDALVQVSMLNSSHETVVDEQAVLQAWVWTEPGFFVYRGGQTRDVQLPGSTDVHVERVDVRADSGWGTFFTPVHGHRYNLTIDVIEPSKLSAPEVRATVECVKGWL